MSETFSTLDRVQPSFETRTRCVVGDAHCPIESNGDGNGASVVRTVTDWESGLGKFEIRECSRCHVNFTDPHATAESVPLLYEGRQSQDFNEAPNRVIAGLKDWFADRGAKRIVKMAQRQGAFSVLDYGCGDGRSALGIARCAPGSEVWASDFEDDPPLGMPESAPYRDGRLHYLHEAKVRASDRKFDLVVLRHVLEHYEQPVELLELMRSHLEPGGRIFIEVPNVRSRWAKIAGDYWTGWYVPRHFTHFAFDSLRQACDAAGLEVLVEQRSDIPIIGRTLHNRHREREYGTRYVAAAAALYPVQIGIDRLSRASTCLQVVAEPR